MPPAAGDDAVSAVAERESTPRPEALPELEARGLACVLCHRRLPPTWRAARLLDVVKDEAGHAYGRYACAPSCRATTTPPPRPSLSARLPRWPIVDRTPPLWETASANDTATTRRILDGLRRLPDTRPPP
jgi:hypothetical protein